jgi:hypothetical protein
MKHQHAPEVHEELPVRGTKDRIALERCTCGALRSVVVRADQTLISDWEEPDDGQDALPWRSADNDNE